MIRASFADPFILLVKDDKSVTFLGTEDTGDLEVLENGQSLAESKWLSGSLYDDANDSLRLEVGEDDDFSNVLIFLLTAQGGLHVCFIPFRAFLHLLTPSRYIVYRVYRSRCMLRMDSASCHRFCPKILPFDARLPESSLQTF